MTKHNFNIKISQDKVSTDILRFNYYAGEDFTNFSEFNSIIETFDLQKRCIQTIRSSKEMLSNNENNFCTNLRNAAINPGGWQSWAPGFEILSNQKQLSLKTKFIPQFNCYNTVPGTEKKDYSKKNILAQFVTIFRIENQYFVIASTGNVNDRNLIQEEKSSQDFFTPPVQFVINRKKMECKVTVVDSKKSYKKNELVAQLCFFFANSFKEAKDKIKILYGSADKNDKNWSNRFESTLHLGDFIQGWESWYNHYANINEKLILDDLNSLTNTTNIISLNKKETDNPCVFQIDDGWEISLGDWDWNENRFPSKPEELVQKIREKNYVPGLWIAPFIIDLRSSTAKNHPDWLLRDKKGKPIIAGMNPLWGEIHCNILKTLPASFYCLDLSNQEVLEHLDKLMDKAINKWGFEYLKLDFLYAGMLNGKFKNGGSAFEHYGKAINILTKRTTSKQGRKICYLGCGAPFEMSFRNFPLFRIGCDTREHWDDQLGKKINWNGRASAFLNMQDTIGRNLWNKTIFLNDPDVLFIRNENCSLDEQEKLLIATICFMFGSQMMYSDDPETSSSQEEIKLAEKILKLKKEFCGKEFEAIAIKKNVYKVNSISQNKSYILNIADKDYLIKDKSFVVRKHSAIELSN